MFRFMKIPLKNMRNGISEALKIKIFWGSMPPYPPSGLHLWHSFSICFLCIPKTEKPCYAPGFLLQKTDLQCVHVWLTTPLVTSNDVNCELNVYGNKSIVTFGLKLTTNCTGNLILDIGTSNCLDCSEGQYGVIISQHRWTVSHYMVNKRYQNLKRKFKFLAFSKSLALNSDIVPLPVVVQNLNLKINWKCIVPKNIHTSPTEGIL